VGYSYLPEEGLHPLLWDGTQTIDLGILNEQSGAAYGINDSGTVVGVESEP